MLTLPEGGQLRLEGFQRLILHHVFATNRVELLVLLPKGNGKTTLFAALAVFHLLTVRSAKCYIGAADADQAGIMYGFAQHFVEAHPWLEKRLSTRQGTKEIRSRRDLGKIKVMASDSSKAKAKRQGPPVTLALIDELHAHDNDSLYTALRSGAFKRQGIVLTISTAGWDQQSKLGQLRNQMLAAESTGGTVEHGLDVTPEGLPVQRDGRLTIATTKSGKTAMLEWALRPDEDRSDPEVIEKASPASFVTKDAIADAMEAPGIAPWDFARYFCNVWTLAFESWLPEGVWDGLAGDASIPAGAEIVAGLDMGRYRDSAALVWIDIETGHVGHRIWASGGKDHPVPYAPVIDAIRDLHGDFRLLECGYDPKYFDQAGEGLYQDGIEMVLFSQSPERQAVAAGDLRRSIIESALTHNGDPLLSAHVNAAQAKDVADNGFRLVKASETGQPIDGAHALAMANRLRVARPSPQLVPFEVIG